MGRATRRWGDDEQLRGSEHNGPVQDFRRLRVWQRAHIFVLEIRRATEAFPRVGYSEMKSQIRRAAESIASNIVEGCAAASRKEFARYLDISIKSSSEVEYRLQLARDLKLLRRDAWEPLANEVIALREMVSALRRAVLLAEESETRDPRVDADAPGTDD